MKRIAAAGALVAVFAANGFAAAPAGALIGCYGKHGRRQICKPVVPSVSIGLVAKRDARGLTGVQAGYYGR